jgi:hypothetical protein
VGECFSVDGPADACEDVKSEMIEVQSASTPDAG